jgi:LacI family transcriptional regulator, galactose operon repressor
MGKGRRASLKDVASKANTSIATASRALSGTGYVAEATRQHILEAARELSYQPNLRARGLRQRISHSIGLIVPNLLNAYYTALADSISQHLAARGYHLLLSSTRDDAATEHDTVVDMVGQAVDGLIWVPSVAETDLLGYLAGQHTPAVAIVRRLKGDPIDTVVFEDRAGSQAATQHLLSLGHERIAYIGGDVMYSSNHDRWQGYLEAMSRAGLAADPSLVKLGTNRGTWGMMATSDLLRLTSAPTAIFVASNAIMPGVMRTLRQAGIMPPDEMSLICFDDVEWFSFSVPPITAVSTASTALAEAAVELLMTRVTGASGGAERPPVLMEVNFEFVLRRSTAAPRSGPLVLREAHLGDPAAGESLP